MESSNITDSKSGKSFEPIGWDSFFDGTEFVQTERGNFKVYRKGSQGPLVCFLHGGGFSALSWSLVIALLSERVECQCVAIDLRGHGETVVPDEKNMAISELSADVAHTLNAYYANSIANSIANINNSSGEGGASSQSGSASGVPPLILIGHSLGGAIAVHVAREQLIRAASVIGLVVIDVVEGTALRSLRSMNAIIKARPKSFSTLSDGIQWCVKSGHIRNLNSARVSFPSQLISKPLSSGGSCEPSCRNFSWRINLMDTEPYWNEWFTGLSKAFLGCSAPKLLLLAGVDRLDKELTIGQMQGAFQLHVFTQSGHAIHEDEPEKVAECIANFIIRYKYSTAKKKIEKQFPCC